jgi:hypothetical protein
MQAMKRLIHVFCLAFASSSFAVSTVELLEPVLDSDSHPVFLDGSQGESAPLLRPANDHPLGQSVRDVLATAFPQALLGVQERNAQRFDQSAPARLLFSVEDGGFARQGFWLETDDGATFVDAPYVDLATDSDSITSGHLEEIWAHETAHILVSLAGNGLKRINNKMHQSMTLTDDVTAFDEGLAIAMQPLTRDHTVNPALQVEDRGLAGTGYVDFWLSRQDRSLRSHGVRRNVFIHPRLPLSSDLALEERYRHWETRTVFDPTRLRTGAELFASEGWMATLLYRLLHHEGIGARPADEHNDAHSITGWPNVLDKILISLNQATQKDSSRALGARILHAWLEHYPEDAEDVVTVLLDTSLGVTVDHEAHARFEAVAGAGLHGDMEGMIESLGPARSFLQSLAADILAGERSLDQAVGPAIWLENRHFRISGAMWSRQADRPQRLNLNTASAIELEALPGFGRVLAEQAIALRRRGGDYRNLTDFCQRLGLEQRECSALEELRIDQAIH